MYNSRKWATLLSMALFVMTYALLACKNGPAFSDVQHKDWNLTEIRAEPEIGFDREQLITAGFGAVFTLYFDEERVFGVAAPNRYFAPYQQGKNRSITIKAIAGTMMAPLREPEGFNERDFFTCLQNTSRWNLAGENLELYTTGENGSKVILVFESAK